MPKISVIIPTFNRGEMVVKCVQSVLATNYPELEVIVVDDCSPEDVKGLLDLSFANDKNVRCVRTPSNLMVAGARNFGAAQSNGDYLLFLDNDNIVESDMLDQLIDVFKQKPDVGLVGAVSIHQAKGRENTIWTVASSYNQWNSQPIEVAANQPKAELSKYPILNETRYAPNATLTTREIFNRVNGFDSSFGMMYEEADFGFRITALGLHGYINTAAVTNHYGFVDEGCNAALRRLGIERPLRTYCFARNRLKFARKHFSFLQILSVTFVFAPLSCGYYCLVALKNKRPDIAWAYLRGTIRGMLGLS